LDENEVLASAQTAAERAHGQDVTHEDLSPLMCATGDIRDTRASEREAVR
jgi:hypothetical protein